MHESANAIRRPWPDGLARADRRARGVGRALAILAGAGLVLWLVTGFIRPAEARLADLPARVHAQDAARGTPYLPLAAIPRTAQQAVVAVENRSFYSDIGISFEGLARAAWVDLIERRFAQGGSTITQDLVRDELLQPHRRTVTWKLGEIGYALLAARRFSKAQVMDMFLNQAYFGHQAYGIAAAARTYFGVPPSGLDLAQAATLAGLLQAPTALDPYLHPRAALARRNVVLAAMRQVGYVSPSAERVAEAEPLSLRGRSGGR